VTTPGDPSLETARGVAAGLRRFASHRVLWHTVGLLIALALAWLILRGYRQPEFILDFASMRLCLAPAGLPFA
jgi:hypothetical protein